MVVRSVRKSIKCVSGIFAQSQNRKGRKVYRQPWSAEEISGNLQACNSSCHHDHAKLCTCAACVGRGGRVMGPTGFHSVILRSRVQDLGVEVPRARSALAAALAPRGLPCAAARGHGERARAHSYVLSEQVRKTAQFWLLTFWLSTFSSPLYIVSKIVL